MRVEAFLYRPTLQTFEWDETIYLLKYKDDLLEVWLAAVPFPVNSQNPTECVIADEIFVRYQGDNDFTQEVPELVDIVKKDGKLIFAKKEETVS